MKTSMLKELCDQRDHWPAYERLMGQEIAPKKMLISPFRKERHPSFNIYRGKDGVVRWMDFADEGGDIYSFLMRLHGLDFKSAVEQLAAILGIDNSTSPLPPRKYPTIKTRVVNLTKTWFEPRRWTDEDLCWWLQYGISLKLLEENDVHACERFFLRKSDLQVLTYEHIEENPLYVYKLGERHKLYRPLSKDKRMRYIGNTTAADIFGKARPSYKGGPVVITAGQKDALTVMANMLVAARSMNAEGVLPDENQMLSIIEGFDSVWVLYDNDETGRKYSERMVRQYPFVRRIDLSQYSKLKDISDVVKAGDHATIKAIY